MLNVDISLVELERSIRRYVDELGLEMPSVIRRTFRLILRDVMSITSPKSNAQGRKAVSRDVHRAIFPLDPSKTANKWLKKKIEARDFAAIARMLRYIPAWKHVSSVVPFDPVEHTKARDSRGRVRRSKGVATPDYRAHAKYVKSVQGRVGFHRSGWAPAFQIAGMVVASWIARHTSPPGTAVDNTSATQKPTMTATHDGKTTHVLDRNKISQVISRRAATMQRDVNQVLSGRASRYFKP